LPGSEGDGLRGKSIEGSCFRFFLSNVYLCVVCMRLCFFRSNYEKRSETGIVNCELFSHFK
jgi:hypothetical protein